MLWRRPPIQPAADDAHAERQYDHAAPAPELRGRGAAINPAGRYEPVTLSVLGEELDRAAQEHPNGLQVPRQVIDDATRTIINPVDSPDIGFEWTINAYRGCEHGCIYCYARPEHERLGFSLGLDFESKIVAKRDAPKLFREELLSRRWAKVVAENGGRSPTIVMSGITDPYQPLERELELTRSILKVALEFRQPVSIITKNRLILRDLDLLEELARINAFRAAISITSLDHTLAAKMEPRASSPAGRLDAVRRLSAAGIPVTVMVAPIIPALTDHEMPAILKAAARAAATNAGYVLLRLPHRVKDLFLEWLQRHYPDRAARVESLVRQTRDGALYDPRFGERQRGNGAVAKQLSQAFGVFRRKYKLDHPGGSLDGSSFRVPGELFSHVPGQARASSGEPRGQPGQLDLFGS